MQRLMLAGALLLGSMAVAQSPVPLPAFTSSFSSTLATRGFWFTAPGQPIIINGIRVPNEANQPFQAVEIIDLGTTPPPAYPTTVVGTQLFYNNSTAGGSLIPCNIVIPAGRVIGVLGCCTSLQGGGTCYSSYGTPVGPFASNILGTPTTLTRFGTQFNLGTAGNNPVWQEAAANVSRVEINVVPAAGLFANFSSNVTTGPTPLSVNFTDQSYSSDPGGVTSWAWDFDGDSVIDSTVQNPTFVYTTCGTYNVSLTVTDAVNPPSTTARTGYIVTDNVTPNFTWAPITGSVYQFTDTSTPTPTSWAWDFNGDNVIDSTVQNPVWSFPTAGCGLASVNLTVNRLCRGPFSVAHSFLLGAPLSAQCSAMAGGNGTSSATYVGNMFDIVVNNPQGIVVCGLDVTPYSFAGAFNCDVYITPGTYLGNNLNAALWRKVGSGTGTTNAGPFTNPVPCLVPLLQSFYLPAGNYGMAVYLSRTPLTTTNIAYTNGPVGPFGNADITFIPNSATAPGLSTLGLFSGSTIVSRVWNGRLYYSTTASGGDPGYGFFAPGCAGTLGIPGNTASALPRLGQTMTANLSRLNMNAAFFIMGFSRTSSIFGPLPISLTPYGAPGCFGNVSTDAVSLIVGSGNTASFSLSVPNNPIYLGNQLYTQGLSLDTPINVLGAVTTDAAAFIVGQ